MKAILLMLIGALCVTPNSLCPGTPAEAGTLKPMVADEKVSINFTGTVRAIEMLGERKLEAIVVHFDPNFAITVDLESVTPRDTPIEEGARAVFAIHSPVQLFQGRSNKEVIGKKYRFKVTWEKANNRSRFSQFTAEPIGKR